MILAITIVILFILLFLYGAIRRAKVIIICSSIFLLLLFIFFFTVFAKREDILQGKYFQWAKSYVSILCPPEDLFTSIMEDSLELCKDSVLSYELKHKYIGEYGVGVQGIAPKELIFTISIEIAGKLYLTEQNRTEPIIQIGLNKYDGYYCLYKIGKSELNSSNIKLTIAIRNLNDIKKNNSIKIFVSRLSDE